MDAKEQYLHDLMFHVNVWNKEVLSHKAHIEKFQHKLEEVAQRNNAAEVKQGIEHFQNRLIRENEVIDTLSHKLNVKMDDLVNADRTQEIDGSLKRSLSPIREEMKVFNKLNQEMKEEILDFFDKWL